MDAMIIFKIAGIGLMVSILNIVLKKCGRDEEAFFVSLAGTIIVFLWLAQYISQFFDVIKTLFMF
ncbi:MAG: stage III sporulation protein AC [Epulopiscium sp.]|nr:stage III sporulation protein AC [Candidatus Epulonipiscium sp.]